MPQKGTLGFNGTLHVRNGYAIYYNTDKWRKNVF